MTDRLYYNDAYLRTFDASVQRVDGDAVILDRTAFYPTSGGQPFDTGTLGGARVVDVIDLEDGTIAHVLDVRADLGRPLTVGQSVHGEIDWARRFDHMQQHSGQHVLSAAFDRTFEVRTVSFHLGGEASTIDLAREMSAAEIAAAETEANRVVWENRPVSISFASPEEAAALPLRKEPARGGRLRLVDLGGFDLSACGGTHVAQTGAIGAIAVVSWERFKGGQRLEFVCGGRAIGRLRSLRDSVTASTRLLSVLPAELPGAIERLQADAKEQKRALGRLQTELARYRAEELAASATDGLVLQTVETDANGLRTLASAIASRGGCLAVLVSASRPANIVVARSSDVAGSAQLLLVALTSKFGGRGGGNADLAQGGGLDASADEIYSAVRAILGRS